MHLIFRASFAAACRFAVTSLESFSVMFPVTFPADNCIITLFQKDASTFCYILYIT